jgi:hypothetical protein
LVRGLRKGVKVDSARKIITSKEERDRDNFILKAEKNNFS